MTQLSVVIPARNACSTLGEQLDALLAQRLEGGFEVLVVDNASTDGTNELVQSRAALDHRLRLIEAVDGLGAGYARNVGIAASKAPAIAFCDADDIVGPAWVSAMAAMLAQHAFVTGPLELDRLNSAEVVRSRGRWLARAELPRYEGKVPFASACNMGVRATALTSVGGFDEKFLIGQDIELSLRLAASGARLEWSPDLVIHYRYRDSRAELLRQGWRYGAVQPLLRSRAQELLLLPTRHALPWRRVAWLLVRFPGVLLGRGAPQWWWTAAHTCGVFAGTLRQWQPTLSKRPLTYFRREGDG